MSNCHSLLVSLRQLQRLERSQISESLTVFLSSEHIYFNAWKCINVLCSAVVTSNCDGRQLCCDAIDSAIEIVKTYELAELKLAGKGVWLLYMLLKFAPADIAVQRTLDCGIISLFVKIILQHQHAAENCMLCLKLMITRLSPAVGLQEVCRVADTGTIDQLPKMIAATNHIALTHIVLKELQAHFDPETAVSVMSFLAYITPRVDSNHNNNYFLSKFVPVLRISLSSLTNFSSEPLTSLELNSLSAYNCELYVNTVVFLRTLAALHSDNVRLLLPCNNYYACLFSFSFFFFVFSSYPLIFSYLISNYRSAICWWLEL